MSLLMILLSPKIAQNTSLVKTPVLCGESSKLWTSMVWCSRSKKSVISNCMIFISEKGNMKTLDSCFSAFHPHHMSQILYDTVLYCMTFSHFVWDYPASAARIFFFFTNCSSWSNNCHPYLGHVSSALFLDLNSFGFFGFLPSHSQGHLFPSSEPPSQCERELAPHEERSFPLSNSVSPLATGQTFWGLFVR